MNLETKIVKFMCKRFFEFQRVLFQGDVIKMKLAKMSRGKNNVREISSVSI
jgi:hypothetical protein